MVVRQQTPPKQNKNSKPLCTEGQESLLYTNPKTNLESNSNATNLASAFLCPAHVKVFHTHDPRAHSKLINVNSQVPRLSKNVCLCLELKFNSVRTRASVGLECKGRLLHQRSFIFVTRSCLFQFMNALHSWALGTRHHQELGFGGRRPWRASIKMKPGSVEGQSPQPRRWASRAWSLEGASREGSLDAQNTNE